MDFTSVFTYVSRRLCFYGYVLVTKAVIFFLCSFISLALFMPVIIVKLLYEQRKVSASLYHCSHLESYGRLPVCFHVA